MGTVKLGQDDERRNLILHTWEDWEELLATLPTVAAPFVCVFACDAVGVPAEVVGKVMRQLLDGGCHYIVCWGPDCERVHDIFDETLVWMSIEDIKDIPLRMSSWHAREPLCKSIWFALQCAVDCQCEERLEYQCILGLCQRQENWAEVFTRAFSAPQAFSDEVLAEDDQDAEKMGDAESKILVVRSPTRRVFLDFRKV